MNFVRISRSPHQRVAVVSGGVRSGDSISKNDCVVISHLTMYSMFDSDELGDYSDLTSLLQSRLGRRCDALKAEMCRQQISEGQLGDVVMFLRAAKIDSKLR